MTEWRNVTLGEVCELKRGYDLPRGKRKDGNVPIISSSGLTGFHSEAMVRAPGVVTGRYGTLGKVFYVTEDFWPLNTSLYVRDFKGNDPRYVTALLEVMNLAQHDGAAAVPGLNRNQLHGLPVKVPDVATQEIISIILGALDDLIENNRRRVEVLEEMARAIYREWFVHFRYPGHENARLVDSRLGPIPIGWAARPFAAVASFTNGFAFKPEHWGATGYPIGKIKELKQGVCADTPRCEQRDVASKYLIDPGDLLFSWSADLGAYRWAGEPGLLNQHLFTVKPVEFGVSLAYLFHALVEAMPEFRRRAQGTTMKHIKRLALSEVQTLVPAADTLRRFTDEVDPIHQTIIRLQELGRSATALRNLLLPKLVTGRIDVSSLDLGELVDGLVA